VIGPLPRPDRRGWNRHPARLDVDFDRNLIEKGQHQLCMTIRSALSQRGSLGTTGTVLPNAPSHSPAYSTEQIHRLRLIRSENVGPITYWSLVKRFGNALDALDALPELARKGGLRRSIRLCPPGAAEEEIDRLHRFGGRLVFEGEAIYPAALLDLPDAPPVLSTFGDCGLFERPAIAIVGARRASAVGRRFARDLARQLGEHGFVVVSGLALGIDGAAHEGALDRGTVAVVAGGIDQIYPPEHAALFERIKDLGLLVGEMPFGTVAQAGHFPRRNRLVSGLSRAVVVVEANQRSGSLITARLAAEQNRDVFAVPGSPLDPRAKGTNGLIKQGAYVLEEVEDILRVAEQTRSYQETPSWTGSEWEPDIMISESDIDRARDLVISLLGPAPVAVDALVQESGIAPAVVQSVLVELELAGRLERHPGSMVSLLDPMDEDAAG